MNSKSAGVAVSTPNRLIFAIAGVLLVSAVYSAGAPKILLVFYLLFYPLTEQQQFLNYPVRRNKRAFFLYFVCLLAIFSVLFIRPDLATFVVTTLLFTALPEEWFFRAYLQTRLGNNLRAIVLASIVFSLCHGLAVSWSTALAVFLPSFVFGWIYFKYRDLTLVILLHGLSNLVYKLYS